MKRSFIFFIFSMALGTPAWAKSADRPCAPLKNACESAGFVKGGHASKKGLYKDCMQPLLAGQDVPGVTLSSDQVLA